MKTFKKQIREATYDISMVVDSIKNKLEKLGYEMYKVGDDHTKYRIAHLNGDRPKMVIGRSKDFEEFVGKEIRSNLYPGWKVKIGGKGNFSDQYWFKFEKK